MKKCKQCEETKPLDDFYELPGNKDGRFGKCKVCVRANVTANRGKNIEYYREYDRDRGCRQTPEYLRERRRKNGNQYRAQTMVGNAVRDKKLFREPCETCAETNNIHGHHDDYLKPLNVRWLCAACHHQWHAINGEALNP